MIYSDAHLSEKVFSKDIEMKPTRDGFGTGVMEAGKDDSRVVVLCADLTESTRAQWFEEEFPKRFIEAGIMEQNMAGLASGMAAAGKIPFTASYAAFNPGRNYEQIRTTIALNTQPVKICGMHAGVSVGPDGATHQMLEDIGMMRMLPGMTVINPSDALEAHKAVVAAAKTATPVYLRFARSATPVFTTEKTPFEIGKALTLWDSDKPKIAILVTGSVTHRALMAASALEAQGINSVVLSVPTIKPLDEEAIISVAKRAGNVITVEEHQVNGGFGSAVAELLAKEYPTPMRFVGIQDRFGQSGEPDELLEEYGLGVPHIVDVARALCNV
ncbi:MAG TPA: transketolase family protein [Candidatus Kaiserbacteria bacterium]|nr:transketolase family protein [Candidatus Kaiserbacteria bacterium]